MKIIISPAKKMKEITDLQAPDALPQFRKDTLFLMQKIKSLSFEEAKKLWNCSDSLAQLNYRRFASMNLEKNLTPALLSYEGIQYQYMAPQVFSDREWCYVTEHLRILSGFYGVLRPLDGVTPYRLEMQAETGLTPIAASLYEFWKEKLYRAVLDESRTIINLASKEYSRCIEPYLQPEDTFITCIFGEWKNGKVLQKGTQAKMARGEMVRYLAENAVKDPGDIRDFDRLNYRYTEELSSEKEYCFLRVSEQ